MLQIFTQPLFCVILLYFYGVDTYWQSFSYFIIIHVFDICKFKYLFTFLGRLFIASIISWYISARTIEPNISVSFLFKKDRPISSRIFVYVVFLFNSFLIALYKKSFKCFSLEYKADSSNIFVKIFWTISSEISLFLRKEKAK